jgi:hypothetical protein
MKHIAIVFAFWLAFGLSPAHAEDEAVTTLCVGTIQKIQGNLWTVPNAPSEPICRARILSRQVKALLFVCKVGQKCAFSGYIIPREGAIDPYWDTIDAVPVR